MKTIRHRREDENVWLELNPIIPDGEIALVKKEGSYGIVIGDGERHFDELNSLGSQGGRIIKDYEAWYYECDIKKGDDIRLGAVEELYINFPETIPDDFYATISFNCDEFGTSISLNTVPTCYFSGTSVEHDEFFPECFYHYTLIFWFDGSLECAVRGRYYG